MLWPLNRADKEPSESLSPGVCPLSFGRIVREGFTRHVGDGYVQVANSAGVFIQIKLRLNVEYSL